jgi:hypothetical protein
MTEPARSRRRIIDALTRGNIGKLRRLKERLTCANQNVACRQSINSSTYGIVFVVVRFQFIPWYLPDMHANMPHLDICVLLATDSLGTNVIRTSV